jgi:hypothetical protein
MVKVFTPNKNGKIEFTKKELENLLNEVWRDGYNSNTNYTNYVVNIKNVDTPEELHFAFVNMNQQQKMVYQKIHNKINENERNTCISARVGMQRKSQNNKNNNTTDESDFQKDNLYYI